MERCVFFVISPEELMTDLMLVSSLLAHPYRTLTTKEVNEHHAEIAELCKSKFGVEIR